jgi:hypothetical protein
MSGQVNFFAMPDDMKALHEAFSKFHDFVVLTYSSPANSPNIVQGFEHQTGEHRELNFVIGRTEDLRSILLRHVPEQACWKIDDLRSPAIKVTASFFDSKVLGRGRVYLNRTFYGANDELMKKSESFCAWADSVLKITKRTFQKQKESPL